MDRILSDRAVKIIVLIVGVILIIDMVNVFFVGGPSAASLVIKPGSVASGSEISSSAATRPTPGNISGTQNTESSSGSVPAIYVPTKATPVPTVPYVIEVTPIRDTTTTAPLRATPPPTQAAPEEDTYALIYSGDLSYLPTNAPTAVAFNVVNPPLVIKFTVDPVMTSHISVSINRSAKKTGPSSTDTFYNTTYPSEESRFTVTVYDKETGGKLDQDGYGGLFDQDTENTFIIRKPGSYLIQFEGVQSTVHVDMLLKKEGNIA
ncbi:hypothetical protein [uncultured Methanoregula sp.]|uniref:hypothetical protein n=1 Tax=uncultured Methanoregula sp. TaxID=1005933 RepID=UPI002AAABAB4|nr:hypothetical protein [uncultured Methanoregula sp.]